LRIVDKCIDVFAQPVVGVQHEGRTAAHNPFGNSLTLLLELL
jgi:hypothetical protein